MRFLRGFLFLLLTAAALHGQTYTQAYTQIVVFGDSLSDTGNFAHTTQSTYGVRIPGPLFGYTDGRFTDGTDTSPAAHLYAGVWLEQLAATLTPVPAVKDSLDAGTNYAYGGATNATGTSQFALAAGFSVPVPNIGTQIATYLATKPTITSKTLFVVWGGANDLLNATTTAQITTAAQSDLANLQTLIAAGATQFIVPNLPPLGAIPRLNGNSSSATAATASTMAYNTALLGGLTTLTKANTTVKIYQLDTYSLFNALLVSPAVTGFANVTSSAQGVTTVNPDTYLFWDDLHPTTYGHNLLSRYARNLLTQYALEATTLNLSASVASPGQVVTLTAKTASLLNGLTPSGLITFYSGSTPLSTVVLDATGTAATTLTAALASSPYTLSAHYSGDGYFYADPGLTTATLTVASPAYTFTASPATVTVVHGVTGTSTLTFAPVGNLTGTFTPTCGSLPTYVSCTFSSTAFTAANNATQTMTVSFITASAAAAIPARPGSRPALEVFSAFTLLGGLAFFTRRRKPLRPALLSLAALFALVGVTGLSGCGGSGSTTTTTTGHTAAQGSYMIPITLTPALSGSNGTVTVSARRPVAHTCRVPHPLRLHRKGWGIEPNGSTSLLPNTKFRKDPPQNLLRPRSPCQPIQLPQSPVQIQQNHLVRNPSTDRRSRRPEPSHRRGQSPKLPQVRNHLPLPASSQPSQDRRPQLRNPLARFG